MERRGRPCQRHVVCFLEGGFQAACIESFCMSGARSSDPRTGEQLPGRRAHRAQVKGCRNCREDAREDAAQSDECFGRLWVCLLNSDLSQSRETHCQGPLHQCSEIHQITLVLGCIKMAPRLITKQTGEEGKPNNTRLGTNCAEAAALYAGSMSDHVTMSLQLYGAISIHKPHLQRDFVSPKGAPGREGLNQRCASPPVWVLEIPRS